MFCNPIIQSTINQFNGNSFGWLAGFGMYSSNNTTYYYLLDCGAGKVFILNDQWSFISSKVFCRPFNMISINNSLYMTGQWHIWKVDQDLNILINYDPGGHPDYHGISYNPSNGFIYVAAFRLKEIQIFNLDLTLVRRISTSPHEPCSITISSNKLYMGKYISILFDPNGFMATTCYNPKNKLYLFAPDGSFTGKSITTTYRPTHIGFDSKGRFVIISNKQISIYN